jgi:predicted dehydrogenase
MLKIGIIGCGKIADSHAAQIQRIPGCELMAACDREELMAGQFCDRFRVKGRFADLGRFFMDRPDVVHITTPPESHFELARLALDRGCHVYVEKPFTLNTADAKILLSLANQRGLKLTVGHDDQFRHVARRMRKLIQEGYLGGNPVHMESYYCYELGESSPYAKALMADKEHWVRRLPGQLLHNIISHGIARIAEFLTSDSPTVSAHGFTSPMLRRMGETEIIDELRVTISDPGQTTAYFTFSSQMRPSLHQFRIFGPQNGLTLDQDTETLIRLRGTRYKSYAEQFIPPLAFARQYLSNLRTNGVHFLRNDFHPKAGMKFLIEQFYRAIITDSPPPIPYREILCTSRIMDAIFLQLKPANRTAAVCDAEVGAVGAA